MSASERERGKGSGRVGGRGGRARVKSGVVFAVGRGPCAKKAKGRARRVGVVPRSPSLPPPPSHPSLPPPSLSLPLFRLRRYPKRGWRGEGGIAGGRGGGRGFAGGRGWVVYAVWEFSSKFSSKKIKLEIKV